MPRHTHPLITWHGNQWHKSTSDAIERKVQKIGPEIGVILALDDPTELADLLQGVVTALLRAWAFLRDVNRAATKPQLLSTLNDLLAKPDILAKRIWNIDPRTRTRIEKHYYSGQIPLESCALDESALLAAAKAARETLRPPARGHPRSAINTAGLCLSHELAILYCSSTGNPPTRTVSTSSPYVERGTFHRFVALIFEQMPPIFRKTKKGGPKSIDWLVRVGIKRWKLRNIRLR